MPAGWCTGIFASIAVLLASGLSASTLISPDDLVRQATTARAAGDYATAIAALEQLLALSPQRSDFEILLAETLAWNKCFSEAETRYRHVLGRDSGNRDAELGLARVLMWEGQFRQARAAFEQLLASRPADALEGRATVEYWAGDSRSAARDFAAVLTLDPTRSTSRRSLEEIRLTARPQERADVDYVDDDQPYRLGRAAITRSFSSDPLTRWSGSVGTYRATAPIYGTVAIPFLDTTNQISFPSVRSTFVTSIGGIRYPDGVSRPTGRFAVTRQIMKHGRVILRAQKQELLATATGMASHPSVTSFSAGWRRESSDGWMAAVEIARLRYFDENRGVSAHAYGLVPIFKRGSSRLDVGASTTFRDSRESRFHFAAVSSTRSAVGFDYAYRGEYAPYWAPQGFREIRAIAVAQTRIRSAAIKLHVDGGVAHDRAIAFGPPSGFAALPGGIYSFAFRREFHPHRADLTISLPFAANYTVEAGYESSTTVFYRAKSFHASLVRHR